MKFVVFLLRCYRMPKASEEPVFVSLLSANATTASSASRLGDHSSGTLTKGLRGLTLNKDKGCVLMVGRAALAKVAPQCGHGARRGLFSCD